MPDRSWIKKLSDADLIAARAKAREFWSDAITAGDRPRAAGFEQDLRAIEYQMEQRGLPT